MCGPLKESRMEPASATHLDRNLGNSAATGILLEFVTLDPATVLS